MISGHPLANELRHSMEENSHKIGKHHLDFGCPRAGFSDIYFRMVVILFIGAVNLRALA